MTETQATSRPWVAKKAERSVGSPWEVYAKNPRDFICITSGNCKANAKLIVKAVNNYEELVDVLKVVLKERDFYFVHPKIKGRIEQILQKIESEGAKC